MPAPRTKPGEPHACLHYIPIMYARTRRAPGRLRQLVCAGGSRGPSLPQARLRRAGPAPAPGTSAPGRRDPSPYGPSSGLRGPSFASVHQTRHSGPRGCAIRGCAIAARRAERICSPGPRGIWAGQPAAADGGCAEGAAPDAARARRAALPARATVMAVTAGRATRAAIWRISAASAGAKRGGRRACRGGSDRSSAYAVTHHTPARVPARTHVRFIDFRPR